MELELEKGLSLNYWLKIPNRILLRFAHFKCRDLPKLFNKVKKMNWAPYYAGQPFSIKVSAHESRLFDDRKITKTIEDALSEYIKRQVPSKKAQERVASFEEWLLFCRFEEDWCTLSLDTSGKRLGLRGNKTNIGLAPLRENLAAALYLFTLSLGIAAKATDSLDPDQPLFLFDPFAGSGTIIQESLLFFEPSIMRNFAFEFFPLGAKTPLKTIRPSALNLEIPIHSLAGEKNENQLAGLRKNYLEANLNEEQNKSILGDSMNSAHLKKILKPYDSPDKQKRRETQAWVMTNPPYGKRLSSSGALKKILDQLFSHFQWNKVGVLLPADTSLCENDYQCLGKLAFSHGGEDVIYSVWGSKTL